MSYNTEAAAYVIARLRDCNPPCHGNHPRRGVPAKTREDIAPETNWEALLEAIVSGHAEDAMLNVDFPHIDMIQVAEMAPEILSAFLSHAQKPAHALFVLPYASMYCVKKGIKEKFKTSISTTLMDVVTNTEKPLLLKSTLSLAVLFGTNFQDWENSFTDDEVTQNTEAFRAAAKRSMLHTPAQTVGWYVNTLLSESFDPAGSKFPLVEILDDCLPESSSLEVALPVLRALSTDDNESKNRDLLLKEVVEVL